MTTQGSIKTFRYDVGEEVVVTLDPFPPAPPAEGRLPSWTIAEITARDATDGTPTYAIAFRLADARHTARVPESAIEGVA